VNRKLEQKAHALAGLKAHLTIVFAALTVSRPDRARHRPLKGPVVGRDLRREDNPARRCSSTALGPVASWSGQRPEVNEGSVMAARVAPGSVAQASNLMSCRPGGTEDKSNSAWPGQGRVTGASGHQPGSARRRNHTAARSSWPDRPPPTARVSRTGGTSSSGGSTITPPPLIRSSACRLSVILALSMRNPARPPPAAAALVSSAAAASEAAFCEGRSSWLSIQSHSGPHSQEGRRRGCEGGSTSVLLCAELPFPHAVNQALSEDHRK
jgi:hypothetical protein